MDKFERELYSKTDIGRAYLEYYDKIGGPPINRVVPYGYPMAVRELGGPIAVYKKCIEQNITWEKLTGYKKSSGLV